MKKTDDQHDSRARAPVETFNVPEAMGRRRFCGCFRSASTSTRSLMI